MEKKELVDYKLNVISQNHFEKFDVQIDEFETSSGVGYAMWILPSDKVGGRFHYADLFEAYADLYRIVTGDLDFLFNEEGYITDKIYKYKEE